MKFPEALTALIDQRYAGHTTDTRDQVAAMHEGITISAKVFGWLNNDFLFRADDVEYGTFDNNREYGLTLSVAGWTFCVYEHRNSDRISCGGWPRRLGLDTVG